MSNSANALLGPITRGQLFVVSAPAGTGKTTLVKMLTEEFKSVCESISTTTREPRENEQEGIHYHFVSEEQFRKRIASEDFLEYVELYGYLYGTSWRHIQEQRDAGNHVVLTIDTQGALLLREKVDAILIFCRPPSLEELRRRLVARSTETPEAVEQRLAWAEHELAQADHYDYLVTNDDLKLAYSVLRSIVIAESHRITTS